MPRTKISPAKGPEKTASNPDIAKTKPTAKPGLASAAQEAASKDGGKRTSAFYMRRMREGLTAAGYVKHDAWVLPENKELLKQVEKQLRQPILAGNFNMEMQMTASEQWTIDRLYHALLALGQVQTGELVVTLVQGAEPSIQVELTEFGGLPVFIAVVGEQIIVDTVLVDQAAITDPVKLNDAVLRSRELFPLSSIGIETMPNGQTVYNIFGSLSSASSLTNVVTEIFTLVENVQRATEAFAGFFKTAE